MLFYRCKLLTQVARQGQARYTTKEEQSSEPGWCCGWRINTGAHMSGVHVRSPQPQQRAALFSSDRDNSPPPGFRRSLDGGMSGGEQKSRDGIWRSTPAVPGYAERMGQTRAC